jgi:methanesulfonate monooxygenase small subunit
MITRSIIEDLVYRAALLLDARNFAGFLALCAPDFRYRVSAHSPEIRKEMVWLDHDRDGMQSLFETLPRHNSDHAPLTRHVTLYLVESAPPDGATASAVSALQVFRTTLDGGATELFAVGKIHDTVALVGGSARLTQRHVKLDTRMLGIGSHIPF